MSAAFSAEFPVEDIRRFEEAMDALAEKMSSLGFPQTLYAHTENPRQPDGSFNAVPEIAAILKRSPETIKYHFKNVYNKLGARNRGHAISQAAKLGLL